MAKIKIAGDAVIVTSALKTEVWFLAGEDSSFITGQVLSPNGGFVIV